MTVRAREADDRQALPGSSFKYISATEIEISRPGSMDAGAIYEFIYPAKDPVPAGLAFVATSDLVSFLRGNPGHDAENPLAGIEHTIGVGISQAGRFLRDQIYQSYNADERGAVRDSTKTTVSPVTSSLSRTRKVLIHLPARLTACSPPARHRRPARK